jgi:oligosaccharyltransferase complex subunit gamma
MWQISYTDGHVTVHKFLEFINKRLQKNVNQFFFSKKKLFNFFIKKVEYQEPFSSILKIFALIISFCFLIYLLFKYCRSFILNTKLWFAGSIFIYVVCMAGIVYNIIHDIPFTTRDKNGDIQWMVNGEVPF